MPKWNRSSAWVFSCKFAACFQNNFSEEHLWMAASEINKRQLHQIEIAAKNTKTVLQIHNATQNAPNKKLPAQS